MAVETAVRVDMPVVADSRSGTHPDPGPMYTGIAVHDVGQWASLCPELDIASVGPDADEAMNNLVQAVAEAVQFAAEQGLAAGQPTPPGEVRSFMVSGNAPSYVRKFYI
jgi:predicted RNase H-like HicB family nuclease